MIKSTLLRSNSTFRKLWIAQLISNFGDVFYDVALLWFLMAQTHSALISGGIAICNLLGAFVGASLSNPIVDKLDTRRYMLWTTLGSIGLLAVAIAFVALGIATTLFYYLVAFCISLVGESFHTARKKSVMETVNPTDYASANNLDSFAYSLTIIFSSVAAGALVQFFGVLPALAINLASFMLSLLFVFAVKWKARRFVSQKKEKFPLVASFHLIWQSPVLRTVLACEWIGFLLLGICWAALPLKVFEIGNGFDWGLQGTLNGVGLLLTSLLFMKWLPKIRTERVYIGAWLLYALLNLAIALSPNVPFFMVMTLFVGFVGTPRSNYQTTLIQQNTQTEHAGKVFSSFSGLINFSQMITWIIGGTLADLGSPTLVMAVASGLLFMFLLTIGGRAGFLRK